ncbi:MAG: hypothetical protein J0653_02620, partial [Deltaproteobacteria bacterium]|nr:hypothetical protein [Deltaproteobacteria bacterium]
SKYLSPNNAFYLNSRLVNEAADAGSYEIPQLSKPASVHKGQPESLPAKVVMAVDGKLTATMYQFWADPIAITSESEVVTNYSKRQNHQIQQAAQIETAIADHAAYEWCPTDSGLLIETSGTASVTGLTANRKAAAKADLILVQAALRRSNIFSLPGKMYGLVTDDVYSDLLGISEFVDYEKLGVAEKLSQGIVGRILGIEIMSRSNGNGHIGVLMNAAKTSRLATVTTAATDRPVSLFWHEAYVSRGDAPVQANVTPNAPGYIGATLLEAWKRFGASPVRSDGKGTVALLEIA